MDSIDIMSIFIVSLPLYFVGTKRLNLLIYPTLVAPIPFIIAEIFNLSVINTISSHQLIIAYGLLGVTMIFLLMNKYGWNYTQALPMSVLIVMAGSFYWEIPYLIRNAFLVGFEWDWILHISRIFTLIAPFYLIGTDKLMYNSYKLMYFVAGLLISVIFMVAIPVAPGTGGEAIWDSLPYLLNRVVCTGILFVILNTRVPPKRGIIFKDKEVNS